MPLNGYNTVEEYTENEPPSNSDTQEMRDIVSSATAADNLFEILYNTLSGISGTKR